MRAFYKQSLWILQNFLLTNPDLHHGLLGRNDPRLAPNCAARNLGHPAPAAPRASESKSKSHICQADVGHQRNLGHQEV
jgi:hypothetical protein